MRERILEEIRRLTKESSTPPGVLAFKRETGIQEHDWRGVYWARWGDALTEAGFAPNEWQGKHSTELVFAKFIKACRHYSRVPTSAELQIYARGLEDFPGAKSLFGHFGSKEALLEHLRAWVTDKAEFADVADMLGSGKAKAPSSNQKEGLVYLIKSGGHYKIGRSDELERRVREIRISLPEAATLVHSIRTDDPAGIEAYWHRRFGEKRANGEWFKLTSADVAAFKRRKFQ
jgi:hypothetical protein